ncbi:MAG: endonuclease [Rhodobacter sp.]|nr:endonuclease [Rhodobacter sp.]
MDNKQTGASMVMTALIAGGIGLVAFVALMVIGDYRFAPALFLGLLLAIVVFVFLLIGFHRKADAGPGQSGGASAGGGGSAAAAQQGAGVAAAGGDLVGNGAAAASVAGAEPASDASAGDKSGAGDGVIKPSKPLAGQDELAAKKGEWKYGGGDAAAGTGGGEDYDKDGVVEGADEGTKPATLEGPRGGGADNLKEIKGVGPKLEKMLNGMGFYHFDQIANWTADEVAWVNANLEGFKGRVSRDDWVAQAKILATGGETEFSTRVDKGEVY